MEPVPSSRHTWIAKSPPALGLLFCALVGRPWKLNVHMCCTAGQTSGYSAAVVWIRSRPPSGGDRVPRLMPGSPCVAQAAAPSSHHSWSQLPKSRAKIRARNGSEPAWHRSSGDYTYNRSLLWPGNSERLALHKGSILRAGLGTRGRTQTEKKIKVTIVRIESLAAERFSVAAAKLLATDTLTCIHTFPITRWQRRARHASTLNDNSLATDAGNLQAQAWT